MTKIAIIGSGGHTRSSINLLLGLFDRKDLGIYDNSHTKNKREMIGSVPLIGSIDDISKNQNIFLSVGNNKLRKKYFFRYEDQLIKSAICHDKSLQEDDVILGFSNQIFANSYINSLVKIENNNIINTGVIIEHESIIGSHNHISIGARICGRVVVGNSCLIGAGAIILDNLFICDNVTIGAGAVVVENIHEPGTYVGIPARKIK